MSFVQPPFPSFSLALASLDQNSPEHLSNSSSHAEPSSSYSEPTRKIYSYRFWKNGVKYRCILMMPGEAAENERPDTPIDFDELYDDDISAHGSDFEEIVDNKWYSSIRTNAFARLSKWGVAISKCLSLKQRSTSGQIDPFN